MTILVHEGLAGRRRLADPTREELSLREAARREIELLLRDIAVRPATCSPASATARILA